MYDRSNLSVMAYANNFTIWHYATPDMDVELPGYFNQAAPENDGYLRKGDLLVINSDTEALAPKNGLYWVTNSGSGIVKITKQ